MTFSLELLCVKKTVFIKAKILGDCRAVLVSGVGQTPLEILSKSGVKPVEAAGFIEEGLRTVYENKKTSPLRGRRSPCADGSCSGSGGGCGLHGGKVERAPARAYVLVGPQEVAGSRERGIPRRRLPKIHRIPFAEQV